MKSDTFLLLLRLALSLSLVFGLMWVAARVVRGRAGLKRRPQVDHLEVLERKQLTKGSSIAIVRVADRTVTVGITETNVTLLGDIDLPADATMLDAVAVDTALGATSAGRSASNPLAASNAPAAIEATGRVRAIELPVDAPVDLRTAPATSGRRGLLDSLRDMTVRHVAD